LRLVPALSGTLSIALLYRAGTLLRSRAMGLLAAAAYAVFPIAVMLDRRAYSYSLVLPFALGVIVCMLRFLERREQRFLYTGAFLLSLLLVTGHFTAPMLVVFLVFSAVYDRVRLLVMQRSR
jgi:4-amino-4-deoxy-L-arabinose transferase-like glycosyltransferase